jgi:hypothetical protein
MCNNCPKQEIRDALEEQLARRLRKKRWPTVMDNKFCVSTIFLLYELRHDEANAASATVTSHVVS